MLRRFDHRINGSDGTDRQFARDGFGHRFKILPKGRRTIRADANSQAALLAVVHVNFTEARRISDLKRGCSAMFFFERGEHEFNMLARAQTIGREVRAAAKNCPPAQHHESPHDTFSRSG